MHNVFTGDWQKRVIPSKSTAETCYVYWIRDASCRYPEWDGYIGVTTEKRFKARCNEHLRAKRFPEASQISIIFRGNIEACYTYEAVLRPYPNMGWNKAAGGARGHAIGAPKTVETRMKIGIANTGKTRTDLANRNKRNTVLCSCFICHKQSAISYLYRDHRDCLVNAGLKTRRNRRHEKP